ncbi:MAG: Hvo_1808 family surface protein [Halobacteriaceae archaeon]
MRTRALFVAALLAVSALAGVGTAAPAPSGAAPAAPAAGVTGSAADAPPDPPSDVLGWEDGVWHNESLDVDQSDGLSEAELERVTARAAARVEHIRRLEFETVPDVHLVNRSAYGDVVEGSFASANITTADRLHQNTKFEALLFVGEDTGYFDVRARSETATLGAFYTSRGIPEVGVPAGGIAVITEEAGSTDAVSGPVLGHELVHALQDQHFPGFRVTGATEEAYNANLSLSEGDATFVGQTYAQRCGERYDCISASGGGGGDVRNWGLAIFGFTPYGNTGGFVGRIVEERGFDYLNSLYRDESRRPVSTEQYIHPEKYPDDRPTEVTVADRSTGEWHVLQLEGGINYATFGEAGIFSMLWAPSQQLRSDVVVRRVVPTADPLVRFNFDRPPSAGWDGDKLYPYVNDSSARTNETGYVWKTAWDSPADAEEFAAAYRELLEYHDARQVGADTYRIPADSGFSDAFHLTVDGDTVTVVNAPMVADLSEVRDTVTVERTTTTTTATETTTTATGTTTTTRTTTERTTATRTTTATPATTGTETTTAPGTPGFTAATAVAALAVLAWRRR